MGKSPANAEFISRRPELVLIDERQWLFLQRRYHLTQRELQVSKLVCRGFSNDETAGTLQICPGTVKAHLRSIYRRVSVKNKLLLLLRFVEDATRFYGSSTSTPLAPIKDAGISKTISMGSGPK